MQEATGKDLPPGWSDEPPPPEGAQGPSEAEEHHGLLPNWAWPAPSCSFSVQCVSYSQAFARAVSSAQDTLPSLLIRLVNVQPQVPAPGVEDLLPLLGLVLKVGASLPPTPRIDQVDWNRHTTGRVFGESVFKNQGVILMDFNG